jgi:hypothetical protein
MVHERKLYLSKKIIFFLSMNEFWFPVEAQSLKS